MEKRHPLLPSRAWSVMKVIAIHPQACLCCTQSQCELCLQVWLKLRVTDEEVLGDDDDDDDDDEGGDDVESETETSAGGEDAELPTSSEDRRLCACVVLCVFVNMRVFLSV